MALNRRHYGARAAESEIAKLASFRKTFMAGVLGALIVAILMSIVAWLGLSPLDLEQLLGSFITRQHGFSTWLLGFAWHLINGGVFALFYAAVFKALQISGASKGALLGVGHWIVAGLLGNILYAMHPLGVPGYPVVGFFFWTVFGGMTVLESLVLHLIFGSLVGLGFRRSGQVAVQMHLVRLAALQGADARTETRRSA
jgi:hypothetical protein